MPKLRNSYFDALRWLKENARGAESLAPETVELVANFTLMWNFFEAALCGTKARVKTFVSLAHRPIQNDSARRDLQSAIAFWRKRYVDCDGTLNHLFETLEFRSGDKRLHVEAVLLGHKNEPDDLVLAAMIIVYRLRNNLFHGLKAIDQLNDQTTNLDMGCRTLAALLKGLGADVVI